MPSYLPRTIQHPGCKPVRFLDRWIVQAEDGTPLGFDSYRDGHAVSEVFLDESDADSHLDAWIKRHPPVTTEVPSYFARVVYSFGPHPEDEGALRELLQARPTLSVPCMHQVTREWRVRDGQWRLATEDGSPVPYYMCHCYNGEYRHHQTHYSLTDARMFREEDTFAKAHGRIRRWMSKHLPVRPRTYKPYANVWRCEFVGIGVKGANEEGVKWRKVKAYSDVKADPLGRWVHEPQKKAKGVKKVQASSSHGGKTARTERSKGDEP